MNDHPATRAGHRRARIAAPVLAAGLLFAIPACSSDSSDGAVKTTSTAASKGAAGEMAAKDQKVVDQAIEDGMARVTDVAPEIEPPALWVGVWDPEKGSYLVAQGEAADGQDATVDDHLRIGSVTKTFTATVILQLVDEGKLSLDDTVGDVLPDLAKDHPEISDVTVEQLLSMTSRIEDYLNVPDGVVADIAADPSRVWTPEELIAAGLEPGLLPEGTVGYSTTNYLILQLMAEAVDGKPLPESIAARITDPLEMDQTTLPIDDPEIPAPASQGHFNVLCTQELADDGADDVSTDDDPTDWNPSSSQGGGGIVSTLADLGTWAESTSGNDTLPKELQDQRLETQDFSEPQPFTYGLGIFELGDGWYGHSGEAFGWQSIELHNAKTGVSVAMASNSCAGQDLIYYAILNELYPDDAIEDVLASQLG